MPANTIFLIYVLIFFLLRIFSSEGFSADEAEQFLNAQSFAWGYSSQAPLFTWLTIIISKIFGLNVLSINLVKYICFYFFFSLSFDFAKKHLSELNALWLSFALLLVPIYAHEFHRDLTHTVLLSTIAMWSIKLFFDLVEKPSNKNYFLLASSFALGILSKYNFVFLIFSMLLTCLFDQRQRKLLSTWKSLWSSILTVVLLMPHAVWLYHNNFSSLRHVVNKSYSGELGFLDFSFEYFPCFLIFIAASLFLFRKSFRKDLDYVSIKLASFSLALPFVYVLVKQITYFNYRWLAPLIITLFFALVRNLRKEDWQIPRLYKFVILAIVFLTFSIRLAYNFFPAITGKHLAIHMPLKQIVKTIKANYDPANITLVSKNRLLLANLKLQLPELELLWIERFSDDYFLKTKKMNAKNYHNLKSKITKSLNGRKALMPVLVEEDFKVKKKYYKLFDEIRLEHEFKDSFQFSEEKQNIRLYSLTSF